MSSLKIIHDRQGCIGCNACVENAPQCWFMDKKDGKARLIGSKTKGRVDVGEAFECDREANQRAADACPVKIIKLEN